MKDLGFSIQDTKVKFQKTKDSIRIMLAQISPAYDPEVFAKDCMVKIKDPDKQANKILKIIEHASSTEVDLLLFPELVAPFSHMAAFEDAISNAKKDMVVCLTYEHTPVDDCISILPHECLEKPGRADKGQDTRAVNFCRIVMNVRSQLKAFTQVKLTPFSVEFSLSASDTLMCGKTVHRFVTNWGNFLFLICKDYVGEICGKKKTPMFDYLKSLTRKGLHYIFVSSLNPEPEAFIHGARSFYYMQERSNYTFTVLLNIAELNNTAVIFPVRPHPKIKPSEGVEMLPLFADKPAWGTQLKFPGCKEQLITGTYVRLDKYEPMATKEFYSPVYQTEHTALSELGIESVLVQLPKGVAPKEKKAKPIPYNLPSPPTPFLGREKELAEIGRLFENPSCRLMTLLGPGGIGKTRLSLQAASQRIGEFRHGVFWVPLAPVSSSDFLVSTIAKSLEFSFRGHEEPKVQLHNYLREKEMLFVMDNFEHLIEGAGLVAEVLEAAPKVKIIVSSRERLNLKGEWILMVEGMCCPETADMDTISNYGAARLFIEGAQRVRPDFTLTEDRIPYIIRICQLVLGMPLAIELASAWMSVLSCKEVVEEIEQNIDFLATSMRDVPERHRSMRAVFEHSWDLLSDEEKKVFMKMSVFRGGFQRDAAKKVTKTSLLLLSDLVNKSLLQHYSSGRYVVHELLRQYAEEKLAECPQDKEEVHDLHSQFYCEFMCQKKKSIRGERQREVLEEIGEEIDNVRAAWMWAVEKGNINAIDRCFDSLWRFYMVRGWYQDGEEMFGQATKKLESRMAVTEEEKEIVFGNVLARHGVFSHQLGRYEKAKELFQRSICIFRKLDAQKNIADTLTELSRLDYIKGDYSKAKQILEKSLSIYKNIGLRDRMAVPHTTLGNIAYRLGELKVAREHYQKSYLIYKELGDRWGMAILLMNMANVEHELGEHSEAKRLYGESLAVSRELGDRRGIASNLNNMGNLLKDLGEYAEAKKLYQESLEIKREIGDRKGIASSLGNLGNIACALGEYDEAKQHHKESFDLSREIGYRWGLVGALIGLGTDSCEAGECEQSKEYFYEALDAAMKISSIPQALDALVGISALFREEKEQALEVLSFIACNPSSYIHTKNKVEELRHEIASKLPPHVAEAAQKRGEARKLEDVVAEILKNK